MHNNKKSFCFCYLSRLISPKNHDNRLIEYSDVVKLKIEDDVTVFLIMRCSADVAKIQIEIRHTSRATQLNSGYLMHDLEVADISDSRMTSIETL